MSETITFEFELKPTYWDRPPHIEVILDGDTMLEQDIVKPTTICFTRSVDFNKTHTLAIKRSGKDDSQCCEDENGNWLDQMLELVSVKIDGINIRDIVWAYSWSEPEYPEPWATEQREQGIELEERVLGETVFGHNTTWKLEFTSPFYKHIMKWMDGQL